MRIGHHRERVKIVQFQTQRDAGGGYSRIAAPIEASLFSEIESPSGYDNSPAAINAGMRFMVKQDGYITGIRFFKNALNSGVHTGSLWSNDGTVLLGQVVFTNETASGWQEMTLATPIQVTANTFYVVSYHTTAGYISNTIQGSNLAVSNDYLERPAYTVSVPTSMYSYTATPAFPNNTNSTTRPNLWVDVVYTDSIAVNGQLTYWETNAEVREFKDKHKSEVYQIQLEEGVEFILRNRPDKEVTKFMQVIFKNRYFTIHGIMDAGYRGKELKLICKSKE